MTDKDEETYEGLNKKMLQVSDEKVKNARALTAHEQLEQEIHVIDTKERTIWNRLYECWGKDRKVSLSLDQFRVELDHNRRKVSNYMEHEKQVLLGKRRDLHNTEDRLYELKRRFR